MVHTFILLYAINPRNRKKTASVIDVYTGKFPANQKLLITTGGTMCSFIFAING